MYRRFLNKSDYLGIITEEALNQLTRENDDKFIPAEQAAEASLIDYLSENFEIEKELAKGKYIIDYDRRITYPIGSHFYFDGKICEVIKSINGYKAPSSTVYWEESDKMIDLNSVQQYSQMKTYHPEDFVVFNNVLYECVEDNGFDFDNIRIPGINAWEHVDVYDWNAIEYNLWDVVKYDGKYFTLMNLDGYDALVNPMDSDNWGMIGNYESSLDTYQVADNEYVVYNDSVYHPVISPNADEPKKNVNITYNDPRNYNIKRHMVQLALYELHKLISPNNISEVRVNDYNNSIKWLQDASRLRLNPQIPRKVDANKMPITDWQMADFRTDFDPYRNEWQV
jgi:hypothetical protein|nr:MAG TPA: Protein of unknown function (DUF1320) [Caudoviricetes sp.]